MSRAFKKILFWWAGGFGQKLAMEMFCEATALSEMLAI